MVLLSACGGGTTGSGHEEHQPAKILGEPAEESEADRTVEISTLDALKFDPERLEIRKGEVVTFTVKNPAALVHEFVLGDRNSQKEHAKLMSKDGARMTDSESALRLDPSETKKLTWRFTEVGEMLYGCHEPGHYDGGMVGTIVVE